MRSPLASPFRGGWRNLTPMRARGRGLGGQFVPQQLGHTALYDANSGGSTTQITDSGGGGLSALAFAASTAAPTYLAAPGTSPYVYLPAVSGAYVSTADKAALRVTGDIELWVWFNPTTPGAGGNQHGVARFAAGSNNRSYRLGLSTGAAVLGWSNDGTASLSATSTVNPSFTSGMWLGGTLDVDNGAGGRTVRFYTHAGGPDTTPTIATATQLGADVVTAGTTSIFAGTAPLEVGATSAGTLLQSQGPHGRAIVRNGINGTTVADFSAADCTQTGYTDAHGNDWAVAYATTGLPSAVKSNAANDIAAGVVADGSNDYATGPTTAIPALTSADACTLYTVTRPRATMTNNMTFFSTRNGTGAGVTLRMASATTVVADISDGTSTVTTPAVTITPGTRYVLGVVIPTSGGAYCFANTTTGSTQARTGNTETGGALTVFANSTPTNYCRTHSRVPYAALPYAASAGQLANLVTYFGGGS